MKNKGNVRKLVSFSWRQGVIAGILLLGSTQLPVYTSAASQDTVRVALFVDAGSTFKSTTPVVTLTSSVTGMAGPKGAASWVPLNAGEKVRFSIDGYKVKALQQVDWKTASAAAKKLQSTSADKPVIFASTNAGSTVYDVYTGPYLSAAEAQKAATRDAQTLSGLLSGGTPEAKGGQYLSAGTFKSQSEAESLRQSIMTAGVDAVVVLTGPSNAASYQVWVGDTTTGDELDQIESQLIQTMPTMNLSPVNNTTSGLIVRSDVTLNLNAPVPVKHYVVTGTMPMWVQGSDPTKGSIQLDERSVRKYRGGFEISKQNGQLALVNELPMDQYLYSVVGGEVYSSWPQEALKAQAVAARSYATFQGTTKFKVAGLVDTTLSQAYNGIEKEAASIIQAVDQTSGEVMKSGGKLVEGVFSSNSGGMSADPMEVWKSPDPTYKAVKSEGDQASQAGLKMWYQVLLDNGKTGYVREDNAKITGKNGAGLSYMTATATGTAVRILPVIQSGETPVAKINPGDQVVVLKKVPQSGEYAWIKGPYTSDQLLSTIKGRTATSITSPIVNLEVTKRGPSGRALEVKSNGQLLDVKYPDLYRSALNGLPSTLFDITPTGRYTVLGAADAKSSASAATGASVLSASGTGKLSGTPIVVLNGAGEARTVDQTNGFVFTGKGNGHGLGMSQWGTKGMADQGKDYKTILQYYYQNVTITKD
ncbi:stage II sporulation protein D [Paenibacillus shirakamiensis]|uniref:Stage II sporulation protein D n=1 Tax=Paenibacillus shirakamiensis TaxID=1265935 RepID=A0ABS4JBA6_9BACL|nr:SpoIID/LytB domain-containing protein [Paenibacillus shirakamiensis]MBP1998996.1 stage II sporulation protein D [Paenibacillus shirakamiensis]